MTLQSTSAHIFPRKTSHTHVYTNNQYCYTLFHSPCTVERFSAPLLMKHIIVHVAFMHSSQTFTGMQSYREHLNVREDSSTDKTEPAPLIITPQMSHSSNRRLHSLDMLYDLFATCYKHDSNYMYQYYRAFLELLTDTINTILI